MVYQLINLGSQNSNCANFIDASSVITTITGVNASWTATENCWAIAKMGATSGSAATVSINGETVAGCSLPTSSSMVYPYTVTIPLKKGQTMSTRNSTGQQYSISFVRAT